MNKDVSLFLDIGSSSVGATLVKTENKIPRIIFSIREPIKIFENPDMDILSGHTLKSLSILLNKVRAKKMESPSKIQCILASPWYISEFRKIIFKKNTPFIFSNKMASDILKKEVEVFKKEKYELYGDLENGEVLPIEMKTLKTTLNGYSTDTPYNQKARELKMEIFISLGSKMFIQKIKDTVEEQLPEREIKFSSFAFHSFTSARDMFPKENFILLAVGGEISDILLVKNGSMNALSSFPVGSNHFIRQVSNTNNISFTEATSLINRYNEGHASNNVIANLVQDINIFENSWLSSFEKNLYEHTEDIALPYIVFVSAESGLSNLFTNMVSNERVNQYAWTENKFKVSHLPMEMLKNLSINRFA
ncbi:MAG: hypothetical protein K9L98_02845 [Candidatus Pacebacteria bacterium]|nr:hypothetical protein [Candidatus Paceibacterota bacterium]MCF7862923.1 hypothetical protein [Candidatus Paceibacterota bacterium]